MSVQFASAALAGSSLLTATSLQGYGSSPYGSSPYGSLVTLGVQAATLINSTHVEVIFSAPLDFSYAQILQATNYTITPTLSVLSVEANSETSVVLTTSAQVGVLYTVVVATARNLTGTLLNPAMNAAQFMGSGIGATFFAIATTVVRVRVVFAQVMLNDLNLSNPTNYTVTDLNGNSLSVVSATPEQASNPISVILTLGTDLGESDFYVCTVSSNIHTSVGQNVSPPTSVFQWLQGDNQINIPISLFSGEVSGPPFGDPDGQVFFSPALNVSTANSIIQVEDVDVCTYAYDTYTIPAPIDPVPLFTYGGPTLGGFNIPVPSPDPYLLNQCVLWAPFPRNFEAQLNVGFNPEDDYVPPVDTSCSILMRQQWALGYVALLNDPAYYLFNETGTSVPPVFITAKNLSPIPPGPEQIIVLHVQLGGTSNFATLPPIAHAHALSSMAGDSQLIAAAGPPPVVLAQASISAGSNLNAPARAVFVGTASVNGAATVYAAAQSSNQSTFLNGAAFVSAFGTVRRSVASHIQGAASVSANATVRRGAHTAILGAASVEGGITARWAGKASPHGTSTATPDATITHKAEAFPVGEATITAAPT